MGNSVPITITVASSKDVPYLQVDMVSIPPVTVDGPQTWESYLSKTSIEEGFASWTFAIKQGQTLTFRRVLHFPFKEGFFRIDVEAIAEGRVIYAIDYFRVLMTKGIGYFVKPGTPYPPFTPPYESPEAYGPGTPIPTFCCAPTLTPTQLVPLVSTSTPHVALSSSYLLPINRLT